MVIKTKRKKRGKTIRYSLNYEKIFGIKTRHRVRKMDKHKDGKEAHITMSVQIIENELQKIKQLVRDIKGD